MQKNKWCLVGGEPRIVWGHSATCAGLRDQLHVEENGFVFTLKSNLE